jgi:hypothetical protein
MTRPRSAPPASALVDKSARCEAGSGLRFAALDPDAAQPEKPVPPMVRPRDSVRIDSVNSVSRLSSWGKWRHSLAEMLTQNRQKLRRCCQKPLLSRELSVNKRDGVVDSTVSALKSPEINLSLEEAALGKARRRVPSDACADRIALTPPRMPFSAVSSAFRSGSELPVLAPSPPVISLLMSCSTTPRFFDQDLGIQGVFATKRGRRPPIVPVFPLLAGRKRPRVAPLRRENADGGLPANACSRRIAPTPRMLCSWLGIRSAALRLASARGHGARSPRLAESV